MSAKHSLLNRPAIPQTSKDAPLVGAFSFEPSCWSRSAKPYFCAQAQRITLWARNATVMPGDRGIPFRTSGLHILSWREAAQTFSAREPTATSNGTDIHTTKLNSTAKQKRLAEPFKYNNSVI